MFVDARRSTSRSIKREMESGALCRLKLKLEISAFRTTVRSHIIPRLTPEFGGLEAILYSHCKVGFLFHLHRQLPKFIFSEKSICRPPALRFANQSSSFVALPLVPLSICSARTSK